MNRKSLRRQSAWLIASGLWTLALAIPLDARADVISILDFDSIALPAGACTTDGTAATAYLSSFGVTFSSPNATAFPQICNGVGTAVTAASGSNWFDEGVSSLSIPQDFTYTLSFATPLSSVSWNTAVLATHISRPAWTATAFNGAVLVDTVGQPGGFGSGVSHSFTIIGTITSLTFNSTYSGQTTTQMPIDDLTLVTPSSAPEPSNWLLLVTVLAGLVRMSLRRHTAP